MAAQRQSRCSYSMPRSSRGGDVRTTPIWLGSEAGSRGFRAWEAGRSRGRDSAPGSKCMLECPNSCALH